MQIYFLATAVQVPNALTPVDNGKNPVLHYLQAAEARTLVANTVVPVLTQLESESNALQAGSVAAAGVNEKYPGKH